MPHQPVTESAHSAHLPWGALFVLILGTFMAVLDGSIVNVALPRMMAIFNASTEQIQWVLTIYLLVGGVVIPATGYLGDRFGYKTVYLGSIAFFTATSMLCGFSWSTSSIVTARALQAIGGGLMQPLSMAMLYRIWPKEKMGMAMGVWGLTMTLAPAIGPTLGGYLVDTFSWRLIFYINLPVGVFTVLLGLMFLKETQHLSGLKLDFIGLGLISGACFGLLLVLSKGQEWGWTTQGTVTVLLLSCFGLLLFFFWELGTPQPVLDVRLLKNVTFLLATVGSSLVFIAMFFGVFVIPIFAQNVQGYSPMQTGLILMPAAVVTGLFMPVAGKLFDKMGAAVPSVLGLSILAVITYTLRHITADIPVHHLQMLLCIRSAGLGLSMMPFMTAGMNTIPRPQVGQASALMSVVRQVAASFGVSLVTYVLVNRVAFHSERLAEGVSLLAPLGYFNYGRMESGVAALTGAVGAKTAAQGMLTGVVQKQAAVLSVGDVFVVGTVMVLLGLPFAAFLTRRRVEAEHRRQEEIFKAAREIKASGSVAKGINR
ncbi:MAG: DHA2 family efflux MFS transporter permease subunit [Bacillota bacterium]